MWLFVGDMSCESFWKDFVDLSLTCWREERRGGKLGEERRGESWEREEEGGKLGEGRGEERRTEKRDERV